MDHQKTAKSILKAVGGEKNINRVFNCATRLRLDLKDLSKADAKAIEAIPGVMGVNIAGNQLQAIIGADVAKVCAAMTGMTHLSEGGEAPEKKEGIIAFIAGIFTPVIPAILGSGMLKAIMSLLVVLNLISTDGQTYYVLKFISDAAFYFLPFMIAYTTSQKFKANPFIAMTFAGILLHPDLVALVTAAKPVSFIGIPLTLATYSSSVIPIILTVWLQSYLEKFLEKFLWAPIKTFLKPTLTILIVAPIMLLAIGPVGSWCGALVAAGLTAMNQYAPWLPAIIMGALSPLIVMTGMHYSRIPISVAQVTSLGYITIDLPGMLAANIAQGGAALCVAVKTKNKEFKQIAASSGFTAVLGITEPAMYGVNLKLKRPFYGVMIGGAAGGLFAGLAGLKAFAPASPGLATLPIFIGGSNPIGNLITAVITAAIAFVVAFVATWFLGFEDVDGAPAEEASPEDETLKAPIKGQVIPLSQVDDPTFADGLMGLGCAIQPEEGVVSAPCDGVITALFPSKHAIGLTTDGGAEILIHVGLETVKLEGRGFESAVAQGDHVSSGQKLLTFDRDMLVAEGFDITTPVIVTNSQNYADVRPVQGAVKPGDDLMTIVAAAPADSAEPARA